MNTCIHIQEARKRNVLNGANVTGLLLTLVLTGCATPVPMDEPLDRVSLQFLVLDGAIGEHQLVEADSPSARALVAAHPAHLVRLVRLTPPAAGVVTLNNVSIPLSLGAGLPPALSPPSANDSKEPRP